MDEGKEIKIFTSNDLKEDSSNIADEWAKLEDELVALLQEKLAQGNSGDIDAWLDSQMRLNSKYIKRVVEIVNKHKATINASTKQALENAAIMGFNVVSDDGKSKEIVKSNSSKYEAIAKKLNEKSYKLIIDKHVQAAKQLPVRISTSAKASMSSNTGFWSVEKEMEQIYKVMTRTLNRELSSMTGVNYTHNPKGPNDKRWTRTVSFKTYIEMKLRTDLNNLAIDTMNEAADQLGIVLYLCSSYGDCAPDHAAYQGRVYIKKNWRSFVPKDVQPKYEEYIKANGTLFFEDVTQNKPWLCTRPNCRHSMTPITFEQALNVSKTLSDLNKKANGAYNPDKYKAMQQQRALERKIRDLKLQKQGLEKQINSCTDGSVKANLIQDLKAINGQIRESQAKIRSLIDTNSNLRRQYDRENPNRPAYNLRLKK